jgi:hypothetical protein
MIVDGDGLLHHRRRVEAGMLAEGDRHLGELPRRRAEQRAVPLEHHRVGSTWRGEAPGVPDARALVAAVVHAAGAADVRVDQRGIVAEARIQRGRGLDDRHTGHAPVRRHLHRPAGIEAQDLPHARVRGDAAGDQPVDAVLVQPAILDGIAEGLGAEPVVVDIRKIPVGGVADADDGDAVLELVELRHGETPWVPARSSPAPPILASSSSMRLPSASSRQYTRAKKALSDGS